MHLCVHVCACIHICVCVCVCACVSMYLGSVHGAEARGEIQACICWASTLALSLIPAQRNLLKNTFLVFRTVSSDCLDAILPDLIQQKCLSWSDLCNPNHV